eukprot:403335178
MKKNLSLNVDFENQSSDQYQGRDASQQNHNTIQQNDYIQDKGNQNNKNSKQSIPNQIGNSNNEKVQSNKTQKQTFNKKLNLQIQEEDQEQEIIKSQQFGGYEDLGEETKQFIIRPSVQTTKNETVNIQDQFEKLVGGQVSSSGGSSKMKKFDMKSSDQSSLSGKQKYSDGSRLSFKKGKNSQSIPYALVEGPEPSQDMSYKWVLRNEKVQLIEAGINIEAFELESQLRDLETEFRLVRKLTETKEHDSNQESIEKESSKLNRYQKLKPFKHTRVRLAQRNADILDSYINANYVNSSTKQNDQIFIATQGPLPLSRENFWRMINQEKVQLIVMLCCVKENGKTKCDQYWPQEIGEYFEFEDSGITLILNEQDEVMPNLIQRKIKIINQLTQEERQIVHLQYLAWPDYGSPEPSDFNIVAKILEYLREHHDYSLQNNSENKIVIHCSAGVGRTGSILAIYNIQLSLERLYRNKEMLIQNNQYQQLSPEEKEIIEPRVSVFGVVRRLREQRFCMVQVNVQYEFIYQYIRQWLNLMYINKK